MTISKISQDIESTNAVDLMSMYVAHLRAVYMVHQHNHWKISNNNFYGNHLLLQRIYEGIGEITDEAAEKCIGVYGSLDSDIDVSEIVKKYSVENTDDQDAYLKSSLQAEKDFQNIAEKVYKNLKEKSTLTLGVDDMIMSHASKSEVHTYLLQQSIIG